MAKSPPLERRGAARAAIVIPVELGDGRGFSLYSTSDLSEGGAFFDRAIPHPVGAQVEVTLRPPGQPPIRCRGEVANVPDATRFGMGVRFLELPAEERAQLTDFIRAMEEEA